MCVTQNIFRFLLNRKVNASMSEFSLSTRKKDINVRVIVNEVM